VCYNKVTLPASVAEPKKAHVDALGPFLLDSAPASAGHSQCSSSEVLKITVDDFISNTASITQFYEQIAINKVKHKKQSKAPQ
jgi:hypothetical protein